MRWGLASVLLFAVAALAQDLPAFTRVQPGATGSAYETARQLLGHLAEGNIEAAAALSNAPDTRADVLRFYRQTVGEDEFKRIFSSYLAPSNPLIAELAIGPRRLLLFRLGEANDHIADQIYV